MLVASVLLVDTGELGAQLAAVDPEWLALAFVLYLVQLTLLGLRWSLVARGLGLELGVGRATGEYAVSTFVNHVVPSGLAGDLLRAVRHSRALPNQNLYAAVEALAIDRASGQLALWTVAFCTAPIGLRAELVPLQDLARGALWLVAGVTCLCLLLRKSRVGAHVLEHLRRFVARAAWMLFHPRKAALHLPLSFALLFALLASLDVAARAIGVELTREQWLFLGPWILVAASAPGTVGGWGTREGASALLFGAVGLSSSAGLAVSIVYGAFGLVTSLLGFALWSLVQLVARRVRAPRALDALVTGWRAPATACGGATDTATPAAAAPRLEARPGRHRSDRPR